MEADAVDDKYKDMAVILKAISDPKRLKIVDMLSCGELCACDILTAFHVTQPTLSHDMKVLSNAKVVDTRREGQNIYYSLNQEVLEGLEAGLHLIFTETEDCICHTITREEDTGKTAI